MNVVLRAHGMRFFIFVDDHQPAHVHVRGSGRVKIDISQPRVRLISENGMKANDVRRALEAAQSHREELLAAWRQLHG
jgi:hypothetical protein